MKCMKYLCDMYPKCLLDVSRSPAERKFSGCPKVNPPLAEGCFIPADLHVI